MTQSLIQRRHALSVLSQQMDVLARSAVPAFSERMRTVNLDPLTRTDLRILQINVGKMCNQVCRHCHVDAGPDRTEIMTRDTMAHCLAALDAAPFDTVDLTGGAPELNPDFRWLVEQIRARGRAVIDRCNLTILLVRNQHDLVDFLAEHEVEVIASLPYFQARQTDAQRGDGVFEKSIEGLRRLNAAGYGAPDGRLKLNLVYNPVGAFLPPAQEAIERDFRRELLQRYDIRFTNLFTITNMPINRYLEYLLETGNFDDYMQRLHAAFNPAAARGVMCRDTLSVGWDGTLHDCDFNQQMELGLQDGLPQHIADFNQSALHDAPIAIGNHCYGCTAGAGSSCGGAVE